MQETLDFDRLMVLAEATPELDRIELLLANLNHYELSQQLTALGIDIGTAIDNEFGNPTQPDEISKKLTASYTEVTEDRVKDLFLQAFLKLPAHSAESAIMGKIFAELGILSMFQKLADLQVQVGSPANGVSK